MSWDLIFEHLYIVLASSILSVLIGVPLGVLACLSKAARPVILRIVDILQTIPSLALLGMIMVFLSPGKLTVIIGIMLYSLLPVVRNTQLGLSGVDPAVKEAAEGMGMTRWERLLRVEFPLAYPMIFTGIRIAVVNAIGTAAFAAFVGGGGLGSVIVQAIRVSDLGMILAATGVLMLMAVILDLGMGWFESRLQNPDRGGKVKWWSPLVLFLVVFFLLLPYGQDSTGDILMYEGNFSETQLLHHMAKMLIEDQTDLTVTIQDQMSDVNNFKAMIGEDNTCDLMSSYDGTLLTTFFGQDVTDVPEDMTIYEYVKQVAEKEYGMTLLGKFGFNNTYAIAVTEEVAQQYDLVTISDLVPVADQLTFGAEHEFFTLEGSIKYDPFVEAYGLNFRSSSSVDIGLKYTAIENGSFEVTEVYATDGLNRKAGLKILEDDLHFFPDYNGAYLIRQDTLEQYPELEDILNQLEGQISTETMTELTYQVDVLGRTVDEVATEFLVSIGLLGE